MRDAERVAVGWFLTINPTARKTVTVTELRCPRGCLLGAVVTIEKRLHVLGVFNATRTAFPFIRNIRSAESAWTAEALRSLTVGQFLQVWEAGAVRMADLKAVASSASTYAVLYPLDHTRKVLRCRHVHGLLPAGTVPTKERKVILRGLEPVPPLEGEQ